jgi:alginate O-acetyltransferase complex protein AlgI
VRDVFLSAPGVNCDVVFSSHIFIFYFFPLALACYFALARSTQRSRNLCLALLGYAFYGWSNPKFIALMFVTTFVDWVVSLVIAHDTWQLWRVRGQDAVALSASGGRSRRQRQAVAISVCSNLVMLAIFKYFNFGLDAYNAVVSELGLNDAVWRPTLRVVLPLGISFYTFQSLSYIVDVYRGDAKAMKSFTDFSCFVSMFPHLVAGPILQFSFLARQLEQRSLTLEKFARGVALFSVGLGKKVLLANPCGQVADAVFNAGLAAPLDAWYGAVSYAFQIYFDFSGYSDMAIGLGLMLGFVFAKNFDSPYKSASITEFWRRWHISLSSWLRDYLYVSLGGSRAGARRTYRNLMLTMLLGGLWHGASWNFVIWGGIHGAWLAAERRVGSHSLSRLVPRFVRIAATFLVVLLTWVFFRAPTLSASVAYLQSMIGQAHPGPREVMAAGLIYQPYYIVSAAAAGLVVWTCPQAWDVTRSLTWPRAVSCLSLLWLALALLFTQSYNPFIYYIF